MIISVAKARMRRIKIAAASATALVALLAFSPNPFAAEPTRYGGFADVVSRGLYDLDATAALQTQVAAITVGDLTVGLEQTPLADIAAHFGGTVQFEGEAGEAMSWVCYGVGDRTIWFMTDGEMGGGKLTIFAVEAAAPHADWNCATLAADVEINAGIPGLGSPVDDVRAKVGPARVGATGRFSYNGEAPVKTDHGFQIYQDVVYEERDGIIVAFGVNQLSES